MAVLDSDCMRRQKMNQRGGAAQIRARRPAPTLTELIYRALDKGRLP